LTEEVAAKVYEHEKFKGVQFRILNDSQKKKESSSPIYEVKVLNHFWVTGMSIERSLNPSLRNFKMV